MRSHLLCALLLLAACSPAPMPCDGGACSDAGAGGGGGAGGGSVGNCPDTQSPPNRLDNPGFECGLTGWDPALTGAALTVETSLVHGGGKAARLTPGTGTKPSMWSNSKVTPVADRVYCMSAWARGKAATFRVDILAVGSNTHNQFASPLTDTWVRVPPVGFSQGAQSYQARAADTELQFRVYLDTPAAGDYAIVDDVQVWESPNGSCTER
jgi:hypothetical protein